MGLNASSDKWCSQLDVIIRGLPFAMKIVDDTIIWAKDETELESSVETVILTDASCLHGIGFALVQVYKDKLALIQCGSASLSPPSPVTAQ